MKGVINWRENKDKLSIGAKLFPNKDTLCTSRQTSKQAERWAEKKLKKLTKQQFCNVRRQQFM